MRMNTNWRWHHSSYTPYLVKETAMCVLRWSGRWRCCVTVWLSHWTETLSKCVWTSTLIGWWPWFPPETPSLYQSAESLTCTSSRSSDTWSAFSRPGRWSHQDRGWKILDVTVAFKIKANLYSQCQHVCQAVFSPQVRPGESGLPVSLSTGVVCSSDTGQRQRCDEQRHLADSAALPAPHQPHNAGSTQHYRWASDPAPLYYHLSLTCLFSPVFHRLVSLQVLCQSSCLTCRWWCCLRCGYCLAPGVSRLSLSGWQADRCWAAGDISL